MQQILGSQARLIGYEIARQHHDYLVLLVRMDRPVINLVVKLAGPEAVLACPFDRTAVIHRLLAQKSSIPVSEILAVDTSYGSWPWRYLVRTHIPGLEWAAVRKGMSPQELSAAYRQIGRAVAQLHSIRFPAFGELALDGEILGGPSLLTALQHRARSIIKIEPLCELFLSVLNEHEPPFSDVEAACLCHEDLHKHNILFHQQEGEWRLAGILDFEKAWAGHSESDLARLELWRGMTQSSFWGAYEESCSVAPSYPQRRPVYQLLWCFEYARTTPDHLADTQRVCAELGIAGEETGRLMLEAEQQAHPKSRF